MFKHLTKKINKNKKVRLCKQRAHHATAVATDTYVIVVLTYAALALAGLLPTTPVTLRALVISLGLFAALRLLSVIARSHHVVE